MSDSATREPITTFVLRLLREARALEAELVERIPWAEREGYETLPGVRRDVPVAAEERTETT